MTSTRDDGYHGYLAHELPNARAHCDELDVLHRDAHARREEPLQPFVYYDPDELWRLVAELGADPNGKHADLYRYRSGCMRVGQRVGGASAYGYQVHEALRSEAPDYGLGLASSPLPPEIDPGRPAGTLATAIAENLRHQAEHFRPDTARQRHYRHTKPLRTISTETFTFHPGPDETTMLEGVEVVVRHRGGAWTVRWTTIDGHALAGTTAPAEERDEAEQRAVEMIRAARSDIAP